MTARSIYGLLLVILALALPSCRKMPVGYLDATHATFSAKELNVYRTVDDDDPHSLTQTYPAPWTSQRIQGVSGTNPVNYEFLSVDVADGAMPRSSLPLSRKARSPSMVVPSTSSPPRCRTSPMGAIPSIYGSTTKATAVSSVASSPSLSKTLPNTRSL